MTESLDELPESLEAAQTEHAEVMQQINEARQFIEIGTRRGIFLEGVIASWSRPLPAIPAKGATKK